jgi:hypothetical protein
VQHDAGAVTAATSTTFWAGRATSSGFDLDFDKPKLVLHLAQARKQRVDLRADVLKSM